MLSYEEHQQGNQLSAALALAALVLYHPAIWLPFLRIERLGLAHSSSLIGGVQTLFAEGHLLVGLIVVLFSIVLPVLKLSALLVLSQWPWMLGQQNRAVVYRLVEHLGRWGMLDVLLVAVMVAFVKLGGLVQFSAGLGLVTFSAFVLLSLCASAAFNPYALWDDGLALAETPIRVGSSGTDTLAFAVTGAGAAGDDPSPQAAMTTSKEPVTASSTAAADASTGIPAAIVPKSEPKRRWVWVIPLLAVAVAVMLVWSTMSNRGRVIQLQFVDGHGIKPGDELRYLGIACGSIERVQLASDAERIQVTARLTPEADQLACAGTRFWIVRPQIDFTRIVGLETVVGANYVALLPGPTDSPLESTFVGLDQAPLTDLEEPDGLEIVLQSPHGAGLRPGLGVYYRDIRIGGIASTGLAGDGSAIETRLYIRPGYRHLIREQARFWNASGVQIRGGLTEFSVQIGTAESILRGGIAMFLPPEPGELVPAGYRFPLHDRSDPEWKSWQPSIAASPLPQHGPPPKLLPVVLNWRHDGVFRNRPRVRKGWVLSTGDGVIGPRDLLAIPKDAYQGKATLNIDGQEVDLQELTPPSGDGLLATLATPELDLPETGVTSRNAETPEDLYLVAGSETSPLYVAAVRMSLHESEWVIDSTLPVSLEWHGAAAIAASDGALVGRLLYVDELPVIVRMTPE